MTLDLEAIKARVEATTPGPWAVDEDGHIAGDVDRFDPQFVASTVGGSNAQFIVHAREDVPALVAAIEAVVAMHQECDTGDGVKFCSYDHGSQTSETWPCDIRIALGVDS